MRTTDDPISLPCGPDGTSTYKMYYIWWWKLLHASFRFLYWLKYRVLVFKTFYISVIIKSESDDCMDWLKQNKFVEGSIALSSYDLYCLGLCILKNITRQPDSKFHRSSASTLFLHEWEFGNLYVLGWIFSRNSVVLRLIRIKKVMLYCIFVFKM